MTDSIHESSPDHRIQELLDRREELTRSLTDLPYDFILYLERAVVHSALGYPDLAAGDAYRALLLTDEVLNESFEYHERTIDCLREHRMANVPGVLQFGFLADGLDAEANGDTGAIESSCKEVARIASIRCFQILSLCLLLCGCLKSSYSFCERGLAVSPENEELINTKSHVETLARRRLKLNHITMNDLPDQGLVRREVYPWNNYEPDRFSPESLAFLNSLLSRMGPKCEVRVASLPVLLEDANITDKYDVIPTCNQLGVFAKEDIAPGEVVLKEFSILTANNRLKESVCDACSGDLPQLGEEPGAVQCPDCYDSVFCSEFCFNQAQESYHPAVCEKDVDSIAKDPEAREADETLHLLLLARVLAMSNSQAIHPLEVKEIKYVWGDFVPSASNAIDLSLNAGPPPTWTLPFSFAYNIEAPLHILEKMDIDIYKTLIEHDLWVFNTIYSKTRGTASARKNPRDGRPDVAAVHPLWCLANHDCNPNVTWDWGGRMVLRARETRVVGKQSGGIRRDEEVLNHYCDVTLPVQERREWARGSLGGWCMCNRCRTESRQKIND